MLGWKEQQLGELMSLNYGRSLSEKHRVPGSVPVYGSNGKVGWHSVALVETEGIIIGRKGSAGSVHFSDGPFFPIDTTFFVGPSDTCLDLAFLYYLLTHVDLTRIIGDVGVPGLNREMAYRELAFFPEDIGEQRHIAAVLGLVQRAIEHHDRLIALTVELNQVVL